MNSTLQHKFHIPVMGLAYTIDSPMKVAAYGISSVISIVEDRLIETMRSYYYPTVGRTYVPITTNENDYRAKRITDYLNLANTIVQGQIEKLRIAAFETGSEIVKYFEMLPDVNGLKKMYRQMMSCNNDILKESLQLHLRTQVMAGNIDVNIMTKTDKDNFGKDGRLLEDGSDAVAALRGYANSDLSNSSIIFSAGMNPRLYNYLEKCPQFDADEEGLFKKRIIIKVSDYRSALIQGKYLAKKGIWVSEFRIESGLNCGGHAFATDGFLMGPILEEFKSGKKLLVDTMFELYNNAIMLKGRKGFHQPHPVKITAQGGIGTFEEDEFLHKYYELESTGWGTPFLLVPEATTVDKATLDLLCTATKDDVVLSNNSPLGVRFHYLKGTSSDLEKQERIKNGKPGSPCTEKHLVFNTEFTEQPICTASQKYQTLKISQLQALKLPAHEYQRQLTAVLDKECLCVGLSNAVTAVYNVPFVKRQEAVTICPGPNIAYFSKKVSLETMVDHIYGRTDIIHNNSRPHMFIAELNLYINYLQEQLAQDVLNEPDSKRKRYYKDFFKNMKDGIDYYRLLPILIKNGTEQFQLALDLAEDKLNTLSLIKLA